MKKLPILFLLILLLLTLWINLLGLMKLMPLFITSPILFIVIFLFINYLNDRKRFKGFR
ncbi:MAG: hypothetical protein IMW92_12900 [Bacillales bacterium]|nr:hypothetical protein [Bacillales bacterium]